MLAAVLGTVVVFAVFELISRRVRARREVRRSQRNFDQLALVCQLAAEEIRLLRQFVVACGIKHPDRLFTSFELFNQCLEETGPVGETNVERFRMIRNKIFFGEHPTQPPIKSTRELKSSQWLHLKRISSEEVFMTPVVEAGSSGLLVVTPRPKGEYLKVVPGERFEIFFWRDRDASYHFESEAIGQSGTHSLITIFRHVEEMERVQRRQYHRVDTSIPIGAIPVTREELDKIGRGEKVDTKGHPGLRTHVVNISGAGFALATRTALGRDDLVYIELQTDGEDSKIPLIGKILSVSERKRTGEFLLHAEFAGLSPDIHERIFQFIYSQAGPEGLPAT